MQALLAQTWNRRGWERTISRQFFNLSQSRRTGCHENSHRICGCVLLILRPTLRSRAGYRRRYDAGCWFSGDGRRQAGASRSSGPSHAEPGLDVTNRDCIAICWTIAGSGCYAGGGRLTRGCGITPNRGIACAGSSVASRRGLPGSGPIRRPGTSRDTVGPGGTGRRTFPASVLSHSGVAESHGRNRPWRLCARG